MKREKQIYQREPRHLERMLVTFIAVFAVVLVVVVKGILFEAMG
jgi:hypothetical protein